MRYKSITKCSLKEAYVWAERHWKRYNQYTATHLYEYRREKNGPYLEKEFISRGYVPYNSFRKRWGFDYIVSNQLINGTKYIYPQKCTCGVYRKNWRDYPYSYDYHAEVSIMGYTKVEIYNPSEKK